MFCNTLFPLLTVIRQEGLAFPEALFNVFFMASRLRQVPNGCSGRVWCGSSRLQLLVTCSLLSQAHKGHLFVQDKTHRVTACMHEPAIFSAYNQLSHTISQSADCSPLGCSVSLKKHLLNRICLPVCNIYLRTAC